MANHHHHRAKLLQYPWLSPSGMHLISPNPSHVEFSGSQSMPVRADPQAASPHVYFLAQIEQRAFQFPFRARSSRLLPFPFPLLLSFAKSLVSSSLLFSKSTTVSPSPNSSVFEVSRSTTASLFQRAFIPLSLKTRYQAICNIIVSGATRCTTNIYDLSLLLELLSSHE